jgi:hypothetical protein
MSATFKEQLVVVPAEAGTHNHRCQLPESRLTPAPTKAAGLAMSAFALTRGSRLCSLLVAWPGRHAEIYCRLNNVPDMFHAR